MKNNGLKRRLAHNFPEKEKRIFRRLQTSPIQVVKFYSCVVFASILFASTKIYLLLNQNRKKKKKERNTFLWLAIACCVRFGFRVLQCGGGANAQCF